MLWQDSRVTKDNQSVLCSCQRDIKSSWVVKEPNSRAFIRPDTGQKNKVFFSSLEAINWGNLDFSVKLRIRSALFLHIGQDKCSLSFVRSDDPNLVWSQTCSEKCWHNFLYLLSFHSVQEWSSWCRNFLAWVGMVKNHWLFSLWPREVKTLKYSVLLWYPVLERSFVKRHWWEIWQAWMHTVLNLESDWSNTKANKPLKKTLVKTRFSRFFAHDYWP